MAVPIGAALSPDDLTLPTRDYAAEAEAAFQCHPEDVELEEIRKTYGYKAMEERAREHQRDDRRRKQRQFFRANYQRFAAIATARNIQRAAEKLHAGTAGHRTEKKPPTSAASEPAPQEAKNTA